MLVLHPDSRYAAQGQRAEAVAQLERCYTRGSRWVRGHWDGGGRLRFGLCMALYLCDLYKL